MTLQDLVDQVEGFNSLPPRECIRLFCWWLHSHCDREVIDNAALRVCYDNLHLKDPNIAKYVTRMLEYSPPDLVKTKGGFKLTRELRQQLDKQYGVHESVVVIDRLLSELPAKVPNLAERTFLDETLRCYRIQAYRAAIVMAWNLAYNHLLNWILSDADRLQRFNASIGKRNSKKAGLKIAKYDDFEDLKEREVIEICNIANLVNSGVYKTLDVHLDRRNTAAHPSSVVIQRPQADDTITDLIHNVVLGLP